MFSFSICIMLKFESFEFKYEQKKFFSIVVLKTNLNRHFYLFYKKENEKNYMYRNYRCA